MVCPSCGKTASSFFRFGFSLQGVSLRESMSGYLRCQNCGTLLRLLNLSRFIWIMIAATLAPIAIFLLLAPVLISLFGFDILRILFFIVAVAAGFTALYLFWKRAKIGTMTPPTTPDRPT